MKLSLFRRRVDVPHEGVVVPVPTSVAPAIVVREILLKKTEDGCCGYLGMGESIASSVRSVHTRAEGGTG